MARGGSSSTGLRLRALTLNVGIGLSALLTLALVISVLYGVVVTGDDAGPGVENPAPPVAAVDAAVTHVEVLNGCGVRGAANMAASILRTRQGFDVVVIGNARDVRIGRSIVLDRTGDTARARQVAATLGVDDVLYQRAAVGGMDVTVIVGYDEGRWDAPFGDR